MPWIILLVAGLFEIGFVISLKMSNGFTKLWPTVTFVTCTVISYYLLTKAMKTIPLGTVYAVWTGIGAFGTAIIGILYFKDPVTFWRVFFIMALVGSIVGLKLVSTSTPAT